MKVVYKFLNKIVFICSLSLRVGSSQVDLRGKRILTPVPCISHLPSD